MAQTEQVTDILNDRLVTAKFIADRYSIHTRTIWVWVKENRLPKPMYRGNTRYWRASQIAEYEKRDFAAQNDGK